MLLTGGDFSGMGGRLVLVLHVATPVVLRVRVIVPGHSSAVTIFLVAVAVRPVGAVHVLGTRTVDHVQGVAVHTLAEPTLAIVPLAIVPLATVHITIITGLGCKR